MDAPTQPHVQLVRLPPPKQSLMLLGTALILLRTTSQRWVEQLVCVVMMLQPGVFAPNQQTLVVAMLRHVLVHTPQLAALLVQQQACAMRSSAPGMIHFLFVKIDQYLSILSIHSIPALIHNHILILLSCERKADSVCLYYVLQCWVHQHQGRCSAKHLLWFCRLPVPLQVSHPQRHSSHNRQRDCPWSDSNWYHEPGLLREVQPQ